MLLGESSSPFHRAHPQTELSGGLWCQSCCTETSGNWQLTTTHHCETCELSQRMHMDHACSTDACVACSCYLCHCWLCMHLLSTHLFILTQIKWIRTCILDRFSSNFETQQHGYLTLFFWFLMYKQCKFNKGVFMALLYCLNSRLLLCHLQEIWLVHSHVAEAEVEFSESIL